MKLKMTSLFSAVILSGVMAQASVLGSWHGDHFILTDSEGNSIDQGEFTITLERTDETLRTSLVENVFIIKGEELWSGETQVGTITDSAVIVEHLIVGESNDDYSFTVKMTSEEEGEFTDRFVYGDANGYWDGFQATLTRAARKAKAERVNLRNYR